MSSSSVDEHGHMSSSQDFTIWAENKHKYIMKATQGHKAPCFCNVLRKLVFFLLDCPGSISQSMQNMGSYMDVVCWYSICLLHTHIILTHNLPCQKKMSWIINKSNFQDQTSYFGYRVQPLQKPELFSPGKSLKDMTGKLFSRQLHHPNFTLCSSKDLTQPPLATLKSEKPFQSDENQDS